MPRQKNRVEAERTSLQFPFYKHRKMQICHLNLNFVLLFSHNSKVAYVRFLRNVTAAMLVDRTIAKTVFWEFDSIIMQNLTDILPLFCTATWPSHHVSENKELANHLLVFTFGK